VTIESLCQTAATTAGLSGTFKAWLAAYIRTDGVIIASNWLDLTDGWIKDPIICDENKECSTYIPDIPNAGSNNFESVFTATYRTGLKFAYDRTHVCNDFTSGTSGLSTFRGNFSNINNLLIFDNFQNFWCNELS